MFNFTASTALQWVQPALHACAALQAVVGCFCMLFCWSAAYFSLLLLGVGLWLCDTKEIPKYGSGLLCIEPSIMVVGPLLCSHVVLLLLCAPFKPLSQDATIV
jgi:hypothetical protein